MAARSRVICMQALLHVAYQAVGVILADGAGAILGYAAGDALWRRPWPTGAAGWAVIAAACYGVLVGPAPRLLAWFVACAGLAAFARYTGHLTRAMDEWLAGSADFHAVRLGFSRFRKG